MNNAFQHQPIHQPTHQAIRLPIYIGVHRVGSVTPADAALAAVILGVTVTPQLVVLPANPSDASAALHTWAYALHRAGRLRSWRGELLPVGAMPAAQQAVLHDLPPELATVERGAARVLGLLTHAVHLVGLAANGDIWVQQRALNKATDPGLWDTLAGGLLSAGDTLHSGVLRETHEEAGLTPSDWHSLNACPMVLQNRSVPDGQIVEAIWTYTATLHPQAQPHNLDGEAMGFACWARDVLRQKVAQGLLTQEAVLSLTQAGVLRQAQHERNKLN